MLLSSSFIYLMFPSDFYENHCEVLQKALQTIKIPMNSLFYKSSYSLMSFDWCAYWLEPYQCQFFLVPSRCVEIVLDVFLLGFFFRNYIKRLTCESLLSSVLKMAKTFAYFYAVSLNLSQWSPFSV